MNFLRSRYRFFSFWFAVWAMMVSCSDQQKPAFIDENHSNVDQSLLGGDQSVGSESKSNDASANSTKGLVTTKELDRLLAELREKDLLLEQMIGENAEAARLADQKLADQIIGLELRLTDLEILVKRQAEKFKNQAENLNDSVKRLEQDFVDKEKQLLEAIAVQDEATIAIIAIELEQIRTAMADAQTAVELNTQLITEIDGKLALFEKSTKKSLRQVGRQIDDLDAAIANLDGDFRTTVVDLKTDIEMVAKDTSNLQDRFDAIKKKFTRAAADIYRQIDEQVSRITQTMTATKVENFKQFDTLNNSMAALATKIAEQEILSQMFRSELADAVKGISENSQNIAEQNELLTQTQGYYLELVKQEQEEREKLNNKLIKLTTEVTQTTAMAKYALATSVSNSSAIDRQEQQFKDAVENLKKKITGVEKDWVFRQMCG